MYRRMILASAVSLVLVPTGAEALGLGELRADSALNQPFLGEIELIDAKVEELDAVKVSLAPDAEFDKVGAERHFFLSKLRFNPQIAPDGRPVIRVTSREPIREPFLDFLVEVIWPQGRLVRAYTVLLDPPVTAERRVRRAVDSPSFARTVPSVASVGGPIAIPVEASGVGFPVYSKPVPAGVGLLQVARRTAPSGATVAQTALALYRNNQDAFIGGDINRLRVGQTLVIPTSAELFVLDEATASQQLAAALAGRSVANAPLTSPQTQVGDALAGAADPEGGRLRIATADSPVGAAGPTGDVPPAPGGSGPLEQELLLVREASESTRQDTDELRDRIRQLEAQLTDIQSLLVLRNEQLAEFQLAQAVAAEAASSAEPLLPSADLGEAPPAVDEAAEAVAEDSAPAEPASASGAAGTPGLDQGDEAPTVSAVEESPATESVPASPPVATTPPPVAADQDSGSGPWSFVGLGVVLVGLLGGAGWYLSRRRRRLADSLMLDTGSVTGSDTGRDAGSEPASMAGGVVPGSVALARPPEDTKPTAPEADAGDGDTAESTQHSSARRAFDDETDVDVFSEADIYIAYGRYREAENLLREEIARSPGRLDLQFKLAEALFGRKDYEGFAVLLDKMHAAGAEEASPEQWRRLAAMQASLQRGALEPETPAVPARPTPTADPAAPAEPGLASFTLSEEPAAPPVEAATPRPAPKPAEPPPALAKRDSALMDLDLNLDDLVGSVAVHDGASGFAKTGTSTPAGARRPAPLVFDLDDDGEPPVAPVDWDSVPVREVPTQPDQRTADRNAPAGWPSDAGADLDQDLGDLVIAADDLGRAKGKPDAEDASTTDFSFVSDSVAADPLGASWPREDSGPWDEVATKLDLARAYLDMKDTEAARTLLDEVAEEGSEAQREEARQMLAGLQ